MSQLERIYHFHREVAAGRYPNAVRLAERFEVSTATAHRDIAYLRDRLLAPLEFDRAKNGYTYTERGFTLPFADAPHVLFLLGLLNTLADEWSLGVLPEIQSLKARLGVILSHDHRRVLERVRCERVEVEPVKPERLRHVLEAFEAGRCLELRYAKPSGERSTRLVDPLRILSYQGRWYLVGRCRLRGALRTFHLARVLQTRVTETVCESMDEDVDRYLQGAFGIFKGEPVYDVKVLFTDTAAAIVKGQVWHRGQRLEKTAEGVVLTLPVADFTEIKMKILQFGPRARVLSPPELRADLAEDARRMLEGYVT